MRFVWVDEHIYTMLMHFKYIIITIHQCYNCEGFVLHVVFFFLFYSDDCSVIHQMYICVTIIDKHCGKSMPQ